jgi:hypothetical protein
MALDGSSRVRPAVLAACAVVAAAAVIATALAVGSGLSCDDLQFDRTEWAEVDRREFAKCVVEVQPFEGMAAESLVRRLGRPDERRERRRLLYWWIGADELFRMKIDALIIRVDDRRRAGPARIGRTG